MDPGNRTYMWIVSYLIMFKIAQEWSPCHPFLYRVGMKIIVEQILTSIARTRTKTYQLVQPVQNVFVRNLDHVEPGTL